MTPLTPGQRYYLCFNNIPVEAIATGEYKRSSHETGFGDSRYTVTYAMRIPAFESNNAEYRNFNPFAVFPFELITREHYIMLKLQRK